MNSLPNRRALMLGLGSVLSVSACGLPRSGPKISEIRAGTRLKQNPSFVVPVDERVARAATLDVAYAFPNAFLKVGKMGSDTINPGDTLVIQVWENVDQGVMGSRGAPTTLQNTQVDGEGYIYLPYAGRMKAADNTPDQLRALITDKLSAQTPNPQVQVDRTAGDGATISIMGEIGGQGVYAIERPTRTLAAMIARAGGVSVTPEIARITLTRGKQSGSIWLKDLYDNPANDIALRPGDVILLEKDTRTFTALGATGQAQVPFPKPRLSALEALAVVGGLQTSLADPKGVFVFREETAAISNAVLGRTDLTAPQQLAYVLDLTRPNGMFIARSFQMRDGDTIYVTEAPYVQWTKILAVLTGSATSANSLSSIASGA